MSPARPTPPSPSVFMAGAGARITRYVQGPSVPYALPGTVGYLGLASALTPYSPTGSGFPGAGNVPPGGWSWTAAGLRNDTSPESLDHVFVYGGLYTAGNQITVTNSKILAGTGSEIAPIQHHGATAASGGLVVSHDNTLGWLPGTMPPTGDDVGCIFDVNGPLYDVQRCDISGAPQGLQPPGSNISGTPSLVLSNWIHDLVQNNPAGPNHMDGIFCEGGSYLTISGNYVVAPSRTDVTACLFFQDQSAATDAGFTVSNNFLSGGGSTFENQSAVGIVVINNTFAGNGYFGDALNVSPGTIGTWINNVHPDGTLVPSP